MAGAYAFFQCVAEAVMAKGLRGLAGLVPFGEQVYDVAKDAVQRFRQKKRLEEQQQVIRKEFEKAAQSKLDQFEQDMRQMVAEVSAQQPDEVRQQLTPQVQEALTGYLSLIPERIRHTFARQEDPSGTTVPATWALGRPEDLIPLLPPRPPRFKPGDVVPKTSGRYVLEHRLGIGGFGEVWKARHTQRKNIFAAFKFCLDPVAHQRILGHEAEIIDQVQTQVEHPNIVKLQEVDLHDTDTPWLQYEYINGGDLAGFVAQWPKEPAKRADLATRVIRVLAHTAAFCHGLKPPIVHRDFKPSNVLLARDPNGEARLKVADFGISDTLSRHALDEARRVTVASVSASTPSLLRWAHTPLYASPQQKEGADPHTADDVHALGVMWYQLLFGNTNLALGADFRDDLTELGLCEELVTLLSRCVAARLERRYPSAVELVKHLDKIPTELLPGRKTQVEVFHRQLDTLYAEADQKNALARQQLDRREYEVTVATLETLHPRLRDPDVYTRAVQFRDRKLWTNSLGMDFAAVPRGTFWMGGGGGTPGEKQVEIAHDFYMGIYPVTQEQWQALMGSNPSYFARSGGGKDKVTNISDADLKRFPVEQVSWQDAQQFLAKLNAKEKDSGWTYTLPREVEWEYSCRGGATSPEDCSWHFYLDQPTNDLTSRQANFGNALERTSKVGLYRPNRLGIYDLHGNVWEWCEDSYDGSRRVNRGGSWCYVAGICRAASRGGDTPDYRSSNLGLRLARVPVGR